MNLKTYINMDYNNPNDNWMQTGYDPYKGMTDDERMKAGCAQVIGTVVGVIIAMAVCALLGSCRTTEYVPVKEVHEHWHHSTDTIHQTDSIIDRQTTTIREVDSATMAQYGIQMKDMQRAWIIETSRLQRELSELRQSHADTIHERDSIPYPVEVVREVPAELTWWQQTRMGVGGIVIFGLIIFVAVKIIWRK